MQLAESDAVLDVGALFVNRSGTAKGKKSSVTREVVRQERRLIRTVFCISCGRALAGGSERGIRNGNSVSIHAWRIESRIG